MSRGSKILIASLAVVVGGWFAQPAEAQWRDRDDYYYDYGPRTTTRYYSYRPSYQAPYRDLDRGYYESNEDFVVGLYNDLLGRSPKRSEVEFWVRSLELGVSRAKVVHDFKSSMEYLGLRTDGAQGERYRSGYRPQYRDDYRAPRSYSIFEF